MSYERNAFLSHVISLTEGLDRYAEPIATDDRLYDGALCSDVSSLEKDTFTFIIMLTTLIKR